MSTINIEVTKNVYDVDLQQNVTSYDVTLEKGYYPLPGGGGGGGDTSNLVPYTGATKNVNIGAYHFESSAGFKKTGGTSSQYLMADGSVSTLPTDLIKGTGTVNYLTKITANGTIGNSLIFDNGNNVGIGTLTPINKFTILGTDDNLPTLGSPSGKFGIFNGVSGNPTYGILQGVLGTGESYIQAQRVDGISVAYDILIQPIGGNIGIGTTLISEKLDVNGYVKSSGFKKNGGTTNQALTADGGVFDLNTKADLVGGKIPSSQLPSYVDDVLEFANLASFPATGESGKIYIAIDTNITYRWGGSSYVIMTSSLALGETSSTAYRGDRGKIAYDHSQTTGNPHGTTKSDIGLGNVPNLDTTNAVNDSHSHSNNSILDLITEPFTTSLKSLYDIAVTNINNLLLTGQRLITSGEITKLTNTSGTNTGDETTSSIQTKRPLKTIEGQSLEGSGNIDLTKNDIGLGNVDNTSDLNKPISTATQNALNTKADIDDIPSKTSFTHDILVSNWTLVSGKYEAVISNAGILANSFVDIIPSNDHVDIVRAAQIYPSVLISAGSVKVYSKFLPSGTITVTVNII